jgi:hypothetical protein
MKIAPGINPLLKGTVFCLGNFEKEVALHIANLLQVLGAKIKPQREIQKCSHLLTQFQCDTCFEQVID